MTVQKFFITQKLVFNTISSIFRFCLWWDFVLKKYLQ